MKNRQASRGLISISSLDEPLVHCGGAGGVGGVFEAGDELGQSVVGFLLGLICVLEIIT